MSTCMDQVADNSNMSASEQLGTKPDIWRMEGTGLLSNVHETCHRVFGLRVWQNHTFSEHPEGVTVIALLAGVVPSRQAIRLQTLTQRPSGPVMLHNRT